MNFKNGLNSRQVDFDGYLGELYFLNLRREDSIRDDNGNVIGLKKRVYNVISKGLGKVIQVSIPADVEEKKFRTDQQVKLVEPVRNFMAQYVFPEVEVIEYITADDIVPVSAKPNQPNNPLNQPKANEHRPG